MVFSGTPSYLVYISQSPRTKESKTMAIEYTRYINIDNANQDLIDKAVARKFEIQMSLPTANVSERIAMNRELELIRSMLNKAAQENELFSGFDL
jgi:hypothetical protein